jgi:molybdenum cofactor biosynthesis enzyme MoaA
MCDSWKMKGKGDLELSDIERIFKQIGKLDAVRLTGGEPFVRDDFADIVSLTVKHLRPFGIHITTNGFLTDRIVHLCENRSLIFFWCNIRISNWFCWRWRWRWILL